MKAVYFRRDDSHDFLIPAEMVENFDRDISILWDLECSDDEESWSKFCSEFDDKYMQYMVEGNLSNIKFYIEDGKA